VWLILLIRIYVKYVVYLKKYVEKTAFEIGSF